MILLEASLKAQVADFLRLAIFREMKSFDELVDELDFEYNNLDTTRFMKETRIILNLLEKIDSTCSSETFEFDDYDDTDILVNLEEAKCYENLIAFNLCDIIREDENIDNVNWLSGLLDFYKICVAFIKEQSQE